MTTSPISRLDRTSVTAGTAVVLSALLVTACFGGGSRPQTQPARPASAASPANLRALYESGRYQEVLAAASSASGLEPIWFAGHSYLRLNRRDDARAQFGRLRALEDDAGARVVGDLATAVLDGGTEAIDRAAAAASAYPAHALVQFELGRAMASRSKFAEAARALDRSAEVAPANAYAYYYAGLAYQALKRVDLAAARFETFVRLAPQAPERPQVESILQALRGR